MPNIVQGSAYYEDDELDGVSVHVRVEIVVPEGYTVDKFALDDACEDALEYALTVALHKID